MTHRRSGRARLALATVALAAGLVGTAAAPAAADPAAPPAAAGSVTPQEETQLRIKVNQLLAAGGPNVRASAQKVLDADNAEAYVEFIEHGFFVAQGADDRELVLAAQANGSADTRAACDRALKGSLAELHAFVTTELPRLLETDDRVRATQIASVGGPEVKAAAGRALRGDHAAVKEFLATGQYVARAKDEAAAKSAKEAEEASRKEAERKAAEAAKDGQPATATLPVTGADAVTFGGAGLAAVALGAGLLVAARRRRSA
ncbi:ALF repeat-containing protein [Longispora sp. K20-0274]|uniref:ALF repeat-containing protein n=1 Tax=Longispora sp. K20-0274 TaxID=3088255 RepID=UPI00399A9525